MTITSKYHGRNNVDYIFEYRDIDSFEEFDKNGFKQIYGICFCGDKMVIGFGGGRFSGKKNWNLVGGTREGSETVEETLKREVREESNMEILAYLPIGCQKVIDTRDGSFVYQLRCVCKVQPYGQFAKDPDPGGVTEIKLIDPADYKQYFDWGEIGEHIISRALELKSKL